MDRDFHRMLEEFAQAKFGPAPHLGDDLVPWMLWLWLTIAVGPWWIGLAIFVAAFGLNWLAHRMWKRQLHRESPGVKQDRRQR